MAWLVAVDSDCVRTDTGAAAVRVVHVLAGWLVARPFDGCECVTQILMDASVLHRSRESNIGGSNRCECAGAM